MKKQLLTIAILLSATFAKAQINLDSNLVLYYPFNGNADDSSVNQINGTLMNGATYTNDHLGNPNSALLFDGVDDYVLSDSSLTLDSLVEPFTITSWVRIDGWYLGSWSAIISKSSISLDLQFRIVIRNDNTYWLAPWPSCGTFQGANLPPVNTWFYLTLIQDTNNITIYVDGDLTNTFICTDSIVTNHYPMTVGADPQGGVTEYFNGAMDEVRIYKRALLPQEVVVLTGINSVNPTKNNFALFPNPTTNELTIQLSENISKFPTIEIFNTMGEKVLTEKLNIQRTNIDVGKLSSGVYFIKMQNESGASIEKFIKQ